VSLPIEKCQDIGLSHFTATTRKGGGNSPAVMLLRETTSAQIEHLRIGGEDNVSGIVLGGALADISIRDNYFKAFLGIATGGSPDGGATGLMDLRIENNLFECDE